jgi:1-acyl-sn-glycerol-3-phosphate acyltransferase
MNLPVPPVWVRRLVIAPLVWIVSGWLLVVAVPLGVIVLLLVSYRLPGWLKPLRVLGFAVVYLACEFVALTVLFLLWVASGFGARLDRDVFQRLHYGLLKRALDVLFAFGRRFFALEVVTAGPVLPGRHDRPSDEERPLSVMSRHAGPGDSFLLVRELLSWSGRRPRIVLKDTLALDPMIDIALHRVPAAFISPNPSDPEATTRAIGDLAATMGPADALLIFPEGGNFTERRRRRAIDRLRSGGRADAAERAEELVTLLPPRVAGVSAALTACPGADVVVVAHSGLEQLVTVSDVWREIPVAKTLHVAWRRFPPGTVPSDPAPLSDWLFDRWDEMQRWIIRLDDEPQGSDPAHAPYPFGVPARPWEPVTARRPTRRPAAPRSTPAPSPARAASRSRWHRR